MKKRLWLATFILSIFVCSVTGFAAVKTMPDGTKFDAAYYATSNPDVAAVVGTDENALYQHYIKFGKAEGRAAVDTQAAGSAATGSVPIRMPDGGLFDPVFYAATYPDIKVVLGDDINLYYQHYLTSGKAEGRLPYAGYTSAGKTTASKPTAGSYIDNITEIGHSLWIPSSFKAEPLTQEDRQNFYVRYYSSGESVIAEQYLNVGINDFDTLYTRLVKAGVTNPEPININGTLFVMYEQPEKNTASFDAVYNGGVIEFTFYPTTSKEMVDVCASVMASYK